jgi:hypothetical protein
MTKFLTFIFRRSFNVTRGFDASTRRALNLAAKNAEAKHLARLGIR